MKSRMIVRINGLKDQVDSEVLGMSEQNVHYETLGLTEASSFEEVQSARKRLVVDYEDDPQKKASIEAAYDAILMERLRLRQEGKIKVPDRIRFAEKQAKPKVSAASSTGGAIDNSGPQWFSDLLDQPENSSELLWPSIIFAGLAALSWVLKPAEAVQGPADSVGASLTLALGMMSAIYFLNKKSRKLWRSMGLAAVGLVVGLALGSLLVSVFSSQGTALAPDQIASLSASITLLVLWFITGFLR
ncbi:MAG: CPP1-like family protein [Cyanobacteria bacterium P01_F01_bin.53]